MKEWVGWGGGARVAFSNGHSRGMPKRMCMSGNDDYKSKYTLDWYSSIVVFSDSVTETAHSISDR